MSITVVNDLVRSSDNHTTRLAKIPGMAGLRERLLDLVERAGGSQRELSRRAGLTEVHVGQIIRRLEKDPAARIEQPTLDAIARGAKVSGAWLSHGVGTPDSDDVQTVSDSHKPELRNLPGWAEAERLARQEHADWPEWVWEATATSSPFEAPSVSLALVEDVARLVMRHRSPAVQAVVTARRAELAAEVRAIQEGTVAPPRPPPPDPEPKRGRRR